jgi:hypothetical protein
MTRMVRRNSTIESLQPSGNAPLSKLGVCFNYTMRGVKVAWSCFACVCVCVWLRVNYKHMLLSPTLLQCHESMIQLWRQLGGGTRQTVVSFFLPFTLFPIRRRNCSFSEFLWEVSVFCFCVHTTFTRSCTHKHTIWYPRMSQNYIHTIVHTQTHDLIPTDVTTLHSHDRVHTNTHMTHGCHTHITKSQYATQQK